MSSEVARGLIYGLVAFHSIITLSIFVGATLAITGSFKRAHRLGKMYATVAILVVLSYILTGACVLTTLERYLRREYLPETAYTTGFIAHYLSYLGIHISDITAFWFMLGALIVAFLGVILHHWPWKKRKL